MSIVAHVRTTVVRCEEIESAGKLASGSFAANLEAPTSRLLDCRRCLAGFGTSNENGTALVSVFKPLIDATIDNYGALMDHPNLLEIPNNLNQIVAEMDLPDGWEKGKKPHRPSYLMASRFLISERDARVAITLREPAKKTYDFMEPQHNHFLQLLRRPGHDLSDDEMLTIALLLDQVGWPAKFKRDWARTTFFPPHNVLQIQGTWVQERIKSRAIILDTTFDSGNYVQEVWFIAPAEIFDIYAAECERIFSSFRWTIATEELTATPWATS